MSRIANRPVAVPAGVTVNLSGNALAMKGAKGELRLTLDRSVKVEQDGATLKVSQVEHDHRAHAIAGTTRALLNNMAAGVSRGFEKKLALVGVGYRAQVQGKNLNLTLGFSHPINFAIPAGITVETPSQTDIVIRGADKQLVGQVAAEIRGFRPPEPYKGKGVRYANEQIILKETKKK
jgi:large subunit ribosomal protein L6